LRFALAGTLLLVVMIGVAVEGVYARLDAHAELAEHIADKAGLTVSTIEVKRSATPETMTLPGSAKPYSDAPIYARTSGYVKRWLTDIGATVERNQLLAELDTPENDQALRQAEADEAVARADEALAQRTATRYRELIARHVVPQQNADEKFAEAEAARAALEARRANTRRLRELEDFRYIRAPFAGVITARKIDVGTLVNASGSSATQLFQLAAVERIRVFVPVPQAYAAAAAPGTEATVKFATHAGGGIASHVVRSATVIDPASRTLLVELEVDNPGREALAGAYADVEFKLAAAPDALRLPAATLMFRPNGMQVASVDAQGVVHLLPVTLGRDFGAEVEVVAGLVGGERVVMNPPDAIAEGQHVEVMAAAAP
jgi:RND family efflux transporter MFP subunit